MRADGSARPSYDSVRAEIASDRRELRRHACACGTTRRQVDGAKAIFPKNRRSSSQCAPWSFLASRDEDALFDAGIYRVTRGRTRHKARRLTESPAASMAYRTRYVRFPSRRLRPGKYVYSIRIRAEANAKRALRMTSRKFVVFRPRHR